MGEVVEIRPRSGSKRIGLDCPWPIEQMERGESVAVDGACLTVTELRAGRFYADVIAETLSRTTLGRLRPGQQVNLERALRLGDSLGGHLVQGHVDGVVRVREIRRRGDDHRVRLKLTDEIRRYVAFKGSVALHGVSLTVADIDGESFEVALIPETLSRTTLGRIRAGDSLNVEVDLLARYLERLISELEGPDSARRRAFRGPATEAQG
jgi:riboflavin synthase